jgi:hypothetical protein
MKRINVLRRLTRKDKWYLGGGNRLLWAPTFPLYLDSPGFWDEAHYYNLELQPAFTWTLLDEEGSEVKLVGERREWNPAYITQEYRVAHTNGKDVLRIRERKSLLPNDVLTCVLSVTNSSKKKQRLHLVAWSVQEHWPSKHTTSVEEVEHRNARISWTRMLRPSVGPRVEIAISFGISPKATSYSINLSERTPLRPSWSHTPWLDKFQRGHLSNETKLSGATNEGLVYLALHRDMVIPPSKDAEVTIAFACSPIKEETASNLTAVLRRPDPTDLSRMSWDDHFASVPYFECSDPYLTNYYWYRWYGLKLNTQFGTEGNYKRPFVGEGIGYFRAPISYSAPCHVLENRWMHDAELAEGSLLLFIDNQREDGGFRGYIDANYYRQEMFYHANWGNALLQLQMIHPSIEYLESVYEGLKKYVGYFDRERDEEVSGLYDIDNHYETGQEYMHRYLAVESQADQEHWGEIFRLKGVDVTVYVYELKRSLAVAAERLGKSDEAELWRIEADKIKTAVREGMWDPAEEMFFDVDPRTGRRTMVKSATCFYPYFTDIAQREHLPGLKRHLLNPKEFWTPFPVPSSSADDQFFSAHPEWKGKRMNCPWNGRVWPMTNSHIAEALATTAIVFGDKRLRKQTVNFIRKFIQMMFFDRDPGFPNCFEHYSPLTGSPSVYRGIDDYQHSWVNDLILKYVCGIRPSEFSVTIDPFPFGLHRLVVDDVIIRGRRLKVQIEEEHFTVWVDGHHPAKSAIGNPIEIQM